MRSQPDRPELPTETRAAAAEHLRWIEDLLAQGYTVRIRATGHSMHPFVRSGEQICLRRETGTLRIGDIVMVITHHGRPLIHRVVRLGAHRVQTQGDSAFHPDAWLPLGHIVGRVVAVTGPRQPKAASSFRALCLGRAPSARAFCRSVRSWRASRILHSFAH